MRRSTFDTLLSTAGLIGALVLFVAGFLGLWAHSFINDQVHSQLAAQKIYFPPKGSDAIKGPQFAAMQKYAGQQLVNGEQAKTYANHFIAVHLSEVAGGKTYSQVSAAAMADPNNTQLAGQVETLFKGTTLRGMLLNAYAFWKIGQIAWIAAWVFIIGGVLMLALSILGFRHSRHVPADAAVGGTQASVAAGV
ncbi:MAG TPA: hypothetical protein VMI11_11070 [Actinomycetes bacterium]|nr:hypothetical protein [Actinomycetes bacterium]